MTLIRYPGWRRETARHGAIRRARLLARTGSHGTSAAFTLLELAVVLALAVALTGGIYVLYSRYAAAALGRDQVLETHLEARQALDTLTQDLLRAGHRVPLSEPVIVLAAEDELWLELAGEPAAPGEAGGAAPAAERIRYVLDGARLRREVYRRVGSGWSGNPIPGSSDVVAEPVTFGDLDADGVRDPGEAPALRFAYYGGGRPGEPGGAAPLDVHRPMRADDPADRPRLAGIGRVEVTLTVRSSRPDPSTGRFAYRTLRADVAPRGGGVPAGIEARP